LIVIGQISAVHRSEHGSVAVPAPLLKCSVPQIADVRAPVVLEMPRFMATERCDDGTFPAVFGADCSSDASATAVAPAPDERTTCKASSTCIRLRAE